MENEQYVIHFHNHKLLSRMRVTTFSGTDANESYPIWFHVFVRPYERQAQLMNLKRETNYICLYGT